MMTMPQSFSPLPSPAPNQMTGVLAPRGAGTTAVDLAERFDPRWVALGRTSWERAILVKIVLDGQECALMPVRDGEWTLYPLPAASPDQLARRRRLELTWRNQSRSGTQFTYELTTERPSVAPEVPAAIAPPVGAYAPHPLAPPPAPMARAAMAPMSPPAIPLAAVSAPLISAPVAAAAPPAPPPAIVYPTTAPVLGSATPVPATPPAAPPAPLPAAPPPVADPGTEHEQHVAGVFGVTVQDMRYIAHQLATQAGFTGAEVLACYVDNFGSAGLEMIPKQWIDQARRQSQQTGVNGQHILAMTVLQSLIARMVEDRSFAELQKTGASGQSGGADFVVTTEVDEAPPETHRNGIAATAPVVTRATGAQVQAMAKDLGVDPGWLLLILRTIAGARQVTPDLIVQLGTAATLRLLVDRYTATVTEDVDGKLAAAKEAKSLEPAPEGESESAPDSPEAEATNRAALIAQGIATRAIDWLAQQSQVGAL